MAQRRDDVSALLRDWAEQQRPVPSEELSRFLAPSGATVTPISSSGSVRRRLARAGMGAKVFAVATVLTVTAAAAAGVAHVARGGDDPAPEHSPVAPAAPGNGDRSSEPTTTGSPSADNRTTAASTAATPSASRRTETSAATSPTPRATDDGRDASPSAIGHEDSSPEPTATEPTAPEPTATEPTSGSDSGSADPSSSDSSTGGDATSTATVDSTP